MTPSGSDRSSARRAGVARCLALALLTSVGCYRFSGGGGLPSNLRSVAVLPFDNQTAVPEVQRELTDVLRKSMQERLSLRDAPEAKASVIVRGVIARYEVDLPAGVSADPRQATSSRRRLQLVIDVEIIDQTTGRVLLKRAGIQREGQYAEGQEASGRKLAIEGLVNDLIEGMQSQW